MKTYIGQAPHRVIVQLANGKVRELDPAFDLANHSPTGFSWGYCGSGPAQLALAILADVFRPRREYARRFYQEFKRRVIAALPGDQDWELTEERVREVAMAIEADRYVASHP